jgi:hypothetical protein
MADTSSSATPIVNIIGNTIALGPLPETLIEARHRWNNDFALAVLNGSIPHPQAIDVSRGEYDRLGHDDKTRCDFAIYERETMRLIGLVDLRTIDYRTRTAEVGILIGEQDCWGCITSCSLRWGITSALRTYRRVGFREIGRRREVCRIGTKCYDAVLMDCLATEFHSPLPPVVTLPEQA